MIMQFITYQISLTYYFGLSSHDEVFNGERDNLQPSTGVWRRYGTVMFMCKCLAVCVDVNYIYVWLYMQSSR